MLVFVGALLLTPTWATASAAPPADWTDDLAERLAGIDAETEVDIGVHVRHLDGGETVDHRTDRPWYLASTIKVPLAVAVMQRAEDGDLDLDERLELAESDWVDGSGDLLNAEPGSHHRIDELVGRSLRDSDSTATDMLIRRLGEDAFNEQIKERMVADGFGPITTILQVRHDAWPEVHPDAANLSNLDFIDLKTVAPAERYAMVLDKLDLDAGEARADSMRAAFERYYERGKNSGDLRVFGDLLEKLVDGELANEAHTQEILEHMLDITTGDRRIQAGLPPDTPFAQKTGTQVARACNVGVVHPRDEQRAVAVVACVEDFADLGDAENAFRMIGEALEQSDVLPNNGTNSDDGEI